MIRLRIACLAALLSLVPVPALRAAVSSPAQDEPAGAVEVVVYEAKASPYAAMFRDTGLPALQRMAEARGAAVRFVDVLATRKDGPGLAAPITMVPTVVVFRDGQETGRIAGLFGPGDFARLLAELLRAAG
jgi:hypothetical protein